MTYEDFITAVATRAEVSQEQAKVITDATLQTLGERISGGEAANLAAELPDRLADRVRRSSVQERGEVFGLGEFMRRVSQRADVDMSMAQAATHAVLSTVRDAVPGYEFGDVQAELPNEYWAATLPMSQPGMR